MQSTSIKVNGTSPKSDIDGAGQWSSIWLNESFDDESSPDAVQSRFLDII